MPGKPTEHETRQDRRIRGRTSRGRRWARRMAVAMTAFVSLVFVCVAVFFVTPWGKHMRVLAAETIVSTRHYRLAQYLTTPSEYQSLVKQLNAPVVQSNGSLIKTSDLPGKSSAGGTTQSPVDVHPINEHGYTGSVMLIHNPKLVRLVPAEVQGSQGEYLTTLTKRVGAVAGINASGFEDPNGNGWGGIPVGLEYVDGKAMPGSTFSSGWVTVGFTNNGVLVMGNYNGAQLQQMGVRDAMQFHPELVVDGRAMITSGDGGWGAGPRTAIGQTADGTVIFVVINGRFHGGSIGATQRDVMNIMLRYGAVNACAMDGGSSSTMVQNNHVINSPSTLDPSGQRHLPDAWCVFPTESTVNNGLQS